MKFSLNTKLAGLALVCGIIAGCGTEQAAETADTSEPETTPVEEAAEIIADQPAAAEAPVKTAGGDPIRGKGGLEEKCLAKVAEVVGGPVNGTNHIEESEAAIEIYVNVPGAEAPWKCLGYKDGTIGDVMYTGSEGAL